MGTDMNEQLLKAAMAKVKWPKNMHFKEERQEDGRFSIELIANGLSFEKVIVSGSEQESESETRERCYGQLLKWVLEEHFETAAYVNGNPTLFPGTLRTSREIAEGMYNAYGATTDFKNFQGNPMPKWEDLPPAIKDAWASAAIFAKKTIISNQKLEK